MWKYLILIIVISLLIGGLVGGGWWYSNNRINQMEMVTPEGSAGIEVSMSVNPAKVTSVEVITLESDPVQIVANIKGDLPSSCASIHPAEVTQDGDIFTVTLNTAGPNGLVCDPSTDGFSESIQLSNTDEWDKDTTYTLIVNGQEQEFSI